MRKTMLVVLVGALLLASCGGDSEDDEIATDDIPAPTSQPATGQPSHDHGPSATADCAPTGNTLTVVASGAKFQTDCFAIPANQQVTLNYDNKDAARHNIVFLESHTATDVLFRADIFQGPAQKSFTVSALKAGTYAFHCEVHPSVMMGTLIVK